MNYYFVLIHTNLKMLAKCATLVTPEVMVIDRKLTKRSVPPFLFIYWLKCSIYEYFKLESNREKHNLQSARCYHRVLHMSKSQTSFAFTWVLLDAFGTCPRTHNRDIKTNYPTLEQQHYSLHEILSIDAKVQNQHAHKNIIQNIWRRQDAAAAEAGKRK